MIPQNNFTVKFDKAFIFIVYKCVYYIRSFMSTSYIFKAVMCSSLFWNPIFNKPIFYLYCFSTIYSIINRVEQMYNRFRNWSNLKSILHAVWFFSLVQPPRKRKKENYTYIGSTAVQQIKRNRPCFFGLHIFYNIIIKDAYWCRVSWQGKSQT